MHKMPFITDRFIAQTFNVIYISRNGYSQTDAEFATMTNHLY